MPDDERRPEPRPALDIKNFALLITLYVFQGTFGGLLHASSLILQENGATYGEQGFMKISQIAVWLKLLWAPLMESVYHATLGKRKSWLIPSQYILGLIMLWSSFEIDTWLGNENAKVNVVPLALVFLVCEFLLCTADMSVDSWALTMLRRENVGYQAPCNIIGFRLGHFLGNVIFLLLRSEEVSGWFGQNTAILSFSGYLRFWSVALLIFNTGVLMFKYDNSLDIVDENNQHLGVRGSYQLIWRIMKMRSIQSLCCILLLCKTGVGPIFSLVHLKLIRAGLKPERLVLLSVPLLPLQWVLPFICRKLFEGSQGLVNYAWMLVGMIPVGLAFSILIWYMPDLKENGSFTLDFYVIFFILNSIEYVVMFLMSAGYMSFMAKITDKKYAAIYLTVLHTVRSIGFFWPMSLSLATVELLTFKKTHCVEDLDPDKCILIDGFYLEIIMGCFLSVCFLSFGGMKLIKNLQQLPPQAWEIPAENNNEANHEMQQLR